MGLWKLRSKHIERKKSGRKKWAHYEYACHRVIEVNGAREYDSLEQWSPKDINLLEKFFLLNLFPSS
jgi:hypothetical protein